jgi:hypothetical protein
MPGTAHACLSAGVGAKTLTLWQACMIASVFEFTGAVALGGQVAQTVAGSITSPTYFKNVPEVGQLMSGSDCHMCVLPGLSFPACRWLCTCCLTGPNSFVVCVLSAQHRWLYV